MMKKELANYLNVENEKERNETFNRENNTCALPTRTLALWRRLQLQGWYISVRGEGKFWVMHAPDGRPCYTALTRQELFDKLPKQFE